MSSRANIPRKNGQLSGKIYCNIKQDAAKEREALLSKTAGQLRKDLIHLGMQEHRLHAGGVGDGNGGYYWSSKDVNTNDTLMLIIPGSGSSHPGLWSTLAFCSDAGPQSGSG